MLHSPRPLAYWQKRRRTQACDRPNLGFIPLATWLPMTDGNRPDAMLLVALTIDILFSRTHLNAVLDKIAALAPRTLACYHGSAPTADSRQPPPPARARHHGARRPKSDARRPSGLGLLSRGASLCDKVSRA